MLSVVAALGVAATVATVASQRPSQGGVGPATVEATTAAGPRPSAAPATPQQRASDVVPQAPGDPPFQLIIQTRVGVLRARAVGIDVTSGQLVEPPHHTTEQWDTAVWVRAAAYPAAPSLGTTYIYGHACHWHICPFTDLLYTRVGDPIQVSTPAGTLTYRVAETGLSPKSATYLPAWARSSTVPDRIVLVTCAYEADNSSVNNFVVAATLVSARRA